MPIRPCSVNGCPNRHRARGMCTTHYTRWSVHGDPTIRLTRWSRRGGFLATDPTTRLLNTIEIDPNTGCWLWTGADDRDGYGRCYHNGAGRLAHRVAYELLVGQIPDGLTIDHLCRVRHCVNPDHLEPVTQAENVRRGRNARRGGGES